MKYVECPEAYENGSNEKTLFMAGGITGCENWQKALAKMLQETNLVIMNPRRKNYSDGSQMEEEQIIWEVEHLKKANMVSFWFSKETLCPITLYELGKMCMSDKKIFIGIDPEYARKRDVEIQTKLIRPNINIVDSIEKLADKIKYGLNKNEI